MSELASTAISPAEVIEIDTVPQQPDFARQPIDQVADLEGLTEKLLSQGLITMQPGEFGFAFRSGLKPGANTRKLDRLDKRVVKEAKLAPGFEHYEKGVAQADGSCISICFWESAEAAQAALKLPAHSEAVRRIEEFYSWCTMDHLTVAKTQNGPALVPLHSRHLNFTI